MPTRKQRRRRAKERRHDYEYVYVDDAGNEVEVEPGDSDSPSPRKDRKPAPMTRAGRKIDPPSWQKVGRRALIFAPLMFLTIRLLEKGEPIGASIARTVFLLAIFLPFSYVMDALIYRSTRRRMEAGKR